jgi:hypothetical protein
MLTKTELNQTLNTFLYVDEQFEKKKVHRFQSKTFGKELRQYHNQIFQFLAPQ